MASKQTAPRKVLIIGGGFAGLECARKLANNELFEVTLLDRTNHHLFQPLLYQVATASLAAPDIARSIRQILAGAKNVTVLMDEVTGISPAQKTVTGKTGGTYHFDYLVLAAGAKTGFFGNDHWEENSLGLKSLADAQDIRRKILSNLERAELTTDYAERERLMTVAIVGGAAPVWSWRVPARISSTAPFIRTTAGSIPGSYASFSSRIPRKSWSTTMPTSRTTRRNASKAWAWKCSTRPA